VPLSLDRCSIISVHYICLLIDFRIYIHMRTVIIKFDSIQFNKTEPRVRNFHYVTKGRIMARAEREPRGLGPGFAPMESRGFAEEISYNERQILH